MLLMDRPVPTVGSTDAELVDRVLAGDHAAFTLVVRRHDDRLRGLAYKLLGGDRQRMDDVLQDAYIRAFRGLGTFRRDAHLGSWLYRIVYNACIDELRRANRRPAPVDVTDTAWDRPDAGPGPERTVSAADAALRALAALPDDQRITVVMVDGEGLDNRTVAKLLDVAPGTVASRLSRARATMRQHLGEDAP
jgi:RNA polymerase sigma-70 factor (ECF subfamily)